MCSSSDLSTDDFPNKTNINTPIQSLGPITLNSQKELGLILITFQGFYKGYTLISPV